MGRSRERGIRALSLRLFVGDSLASLRTLIGPKGEGGGGGDHAELTNTAEHRSEQRPRGFNTLQLRERRASRKANKIDDLGGGGLSVPASLLSHLDLFSEVAVRGAFVASLETSTHPPTCKPRDADMYCDSRSQLTHGQAPVCACACVCAPGPQHRR